MYIIVFITTPSKKEAKRIAQALLKNKLAACVNIVERIKSLFWWQEKINCASETLLIIKSRKSKLKQIIRRVKSLHSYDTPEIIALPIIGGEKKYLRWLNESIRKSR